MINLAASREGASTDQPPVDPTRINFPRCVILHYSPFKAIWDWITLLLVLYIALVTPYLAAFNTNSTVNSTSPISANSTTEPPASNGRPRFPLEPLVIIDIIVDIMFLADIFVNFRTTFLSNGEVVTDPKKIAINYVKGWFVIDLIATIPFDLLLFRVPSDVSSSKYL